MASRNPFQWAEFLRETDAFLEGRGKMPATVVQAHLAESGYFARWSIPSEKQIKHLMAWYRARRRGNYGTVEERAFLAFFRALDRSDRRRAAAMIRSGQMKRYRKN